MSKEIEVNWKTKHKKFGEIHIKSINLDSNYMWTNNEEFSCIGADSIFAKELYPTIPMLMNKELKQALTQPTEQEVCEALSEYLKRRVVYDDVLNMFVEVKGGRAKGRIIARLRVNKLNIPHDLPPHLITMICRFYEKEKVKIYLYK